jgi:hypothetical protein
MDNSELVIETNDLEDQEWSDEDDDPYRTEDDKADDEFAEFEFDEEYDSSGGNDGGDM